MCLSLATSFRATVQCDMTLSYEWHDSFKRVTWLIKNVTCLVRATTVMCDLTLLYVWHDSFICERQVVLFGNTSFHATVMRGMTHLCEWHDSFMWVTWLIHMQTPGTGWRRPIGCLDLQVFCHKRATNYRALLRKMTYNDVASYGSSPPCSALWQHELSGYCRLIHVWDMTHSSMWHDSLIGVTWRIRICDMPHSYVWHASFICVTWLIHMCDMTPWYVHLWSPAFVLLLHAIWLFYMALLCVWQDSFVYATWLLHVCDMTHLYVRHDSFICETWLIHMWDNTHSYVWHDSSICVTWLIHMWTPGGALWQPAFVLRLHVTRLMHMCDITYSYVTWLIHMCDLTHSYVWHDSFICVI